MLSSVASRLARMEQRLGEAELQVVTEASGGATLREITSALVDALNPDGFLIPNHLAAQGFYLLRARTQLREITSILLK